MYLLFFNLYLAMFRGVWQNLTFTEINGPLTACLNAVGTLATSIFGDNQINDFGTIMVTPVDNLRPFMVLIAFVLALITSIGIVVMAVKGVKKAFGIFFGHIR